MNTKNYFKSMWTGLLFLVLSMSLLGSPQSEDPSQEHTYYYSVEINDVLCGYDKTDIAVKTLDSKLSLVVTEDVVVKLTLLGQGMDMRFNTEYHIDPVTSKVVYIDRKIRAGNTDIHSTTTINGDLAQFSSTFTGEEKTIDLSGGVIVESPLAYPHLKTDFIRGGEKEKTYKVFEDVRGNIEDRKYTFGGYDELELVGTTYLVALFNELNLATGVSTEIWIDRETSVPLKYEGSGRTVTLADKSVMKRIAVANFDDLIFARVDEMITDLHNIGYMKVKATIQSAGSWITPESLNIPGQKFTGSVEENLIDGIFEIEPVRYSGEGAPPFPPDYSMEGSLQEYIQPGELIESDDPLIINEARSITEGSQDSWEAIVRLSKWVGEEIRYAIPGGTSAINTYKTREGECGSHSRLLAAFCRAVGIPARLSIGCMYTPNYGGSFGQHAWTEVWMGDAGWIAVDATAFEYDFVDAGHIRLGENATFNPKSMEILEYRMLEMDASTEEEKTDKYDPYVGKYTLMEKGEVFTVLMQNNTLAVDIPNKIVLTLNEPDEEGRWYPTLSRQLNFTFEKDDSGNIDKMMLQQLVPVNKSSDPEKTGKDVPDEMMAYLGLYSLPQANINLNVTYEDGSLLIIDSRDNEPIKLSEKQENGRFLVEKNEDEIEFIANSEGNIQSLLIYSNNMLERGEPVTGVIEKEITENGIDQGLARYYEIKNEDTEEYIFSERLMNALGYKFLNDGKIDEAIAIFKLNVEEYPDSFNVYDSLGEAYYKKGDNKLAKTNYKKSLKLNPDNENGKKMLERIKSGN
jgi:tetratricopeptide (TPR) repeat protein